MTRTIHVNAKLTPRQRKALHEEKGLTLKQLSEKYRVSVPTICKWRKRTDFDDRTHAPTSPKLILSAFEQHLVCEVRKTTRFSVEDLIHVLKPHIPRIGKGNVYRLLVRERLNRKAYLLAEKKKSNPKKFKAYPPGYLHIDMKYLPEVDKPRPYLFVAIRQEHPTGHHRCLPRIGGQTGRKVPKPLHSLFRIPHILRAY